MADLVHLNYHLALVINRFGIKLGFGDKTIEEICGEHNIDADFFVEIANAFNDKDYRPRKNLKNFPVKQTVSYLQHTHSYFIDEELPRIQRLIDNVIDANSSQKKGFVLMKNFFREYQEELTAHIRREEKTVYPYAVYIENAYNNRLIDKQLTDALSMYSMETYAREHEDVEEKLFDLKNIIIKYLPPPTDNRYYNEILFNLFRLESDLNEHSRIENTVLVPVIRLMESELRKLTN
jgi:regulator of cell morphogenesis and NO signaling